MRKKNHIKTHKMIKTIVTLFLALILTITLIACKKDQKLVDIEITPPTKLVYLVGEEFNNSGLIVQAVYDDGSKKVVNDYEISGFDSSKIGSVQMTVTYKQFSKNFEITIKEDDRSEITTTKVVTYDVPEPYQTSTNFKASVEGEELFVYETLVNHRRVFSWAAPVTTVPVAMFDFEGKVRVSIDVVGKNIENPIVRPLSSGVEAKVVDGKIEFELSYPENYTIEYDIVGEPLENNIGAHAFHLFASEIEKDPITKEQADVIAMLQLFSKEYLKEVIKANFDYYEPRTEHGSSLSASMYALVACLIEKPDYAYQHFIKSATVDLTGKSKQFAGGIYIGGTHPAASGGAYMTAIYGFSLLEFTDDFFTVKSNLPSNIHAIEYKLIFNNELYNIKVNQSKTYIRKEVNYEI